MAPRAQKQSVSDTSPPMDDGEVEVRAQLELIAERRKERGIGFDRDMAMATAALGRVLVSYESERRQKSKAAIREVASIPLERVIAYLKSLPMSARAEIARDITDSDAEAPLI